MMIMMEMIRSHPSETNFFSHLLEANWLPPLRPCEYSWTKKEAQKGVIFLFDQTILWNLENVIQRILDISSFNKEK